MSNTSETVKLLLGKKRLSGCTLDAGNIGSLAYSWNVVAITNSDAYKGMQELLNDRSTTSKVLWEHDPQMLRMLRTWIQSTNVITKAIAGRVAEMEKLMAENPEILQELEAKKAAAEQGSNI